MSAKLYVTAVMSLLQVQQKSLSMLKYAQSVIRSIQDSRELHLLVVPLISSIVDTELSRTDTKYKIETVAIRRRRQQSKTTIIWIYFGKTESLVRRPYFFRRTV